MTTLKISIPHKIGFLTITSHNRRHIPSAWSDINERRRRLLFIQLLISLPLELAMLDIVRELLGMSKRQFSLVDPADIAAISDQLSWMNLEPSTQPIIETFNHKGKIYALPKPDFNGGSAYEFAQCDDYYQEWLDNIQSEQPLLRLIATLARPHSPTQIRKTGDARQPLSHDSREAEYDIEGRAETFKDLDITAVITVLRFFEGVKKDVHEYGVASGIFEKPKAEEDNEKPKPNNLFGWWTAFRSIAKAQNKTEEQIWAMSLWRVLSIMIEEKMKADELERLQKQND
jgi:hypothetical protein